MIRSVFSLVIAAVLFGLVAISRAELPLAALVFVSVFGILFCVVAWGSIRHHNALTLARKTAPVPASIFVRSTPQRRGPDRLIAEITIEGETWRGTLTGWAGERAFANKTSDGLAWLAPKNGAPLEVKVNDKLLTPIPIVVKVNENSILERLIRKIHFDDKKG